MRNFLINSVNSGCFGVDVTEMSVMPVRNISHCNQNDLCINFYLYLQVDLQALEQQIKDRKQQEDYEQKRSDAFGKRIN